MSTPGRVQRALAKYNIVDENINARVRSSAGASIELESAYIDVEVNITYIPIHPLKYLQFFLYSILVKLALVHHLNCLIWISIPVALIFGFHL